MKEIVDQLRLNIQLHEILVNLADSANQKYVRTIEKLCKSLYLSVSLAPCAILFAWTVTNKTDLRKRVC